MIRLHELSLRRGSKLLFADASLVIPDGHKVGVVGRNGSGKSSLFDCIRGCLSPDAGGVELSPGMAIAHVAQETPATATPAIEYVIDGDRRLRKIESLIVEAQTGGDGARLAELHAELEAGGGYRARARAGALLHGLGFAGEELARPVRAFSGGWQMRLNLAQALMCPSDLLLLDEPTNHLDLDAVLWLEGWLKSYPGTLLLITHDREFLDNVVDHIVHLDGRRVSLHRGGYSDFERRHASELARTEALRERQLRERKHVQAFVDRFRAKASKARQAQSRLKALERMETIALAHVDSPFRFEFPIPEKLPNPMLRLEDIAVGYDGTAVLQRIGLTVIPGMRVGLVGPNGAGKSTFIKLLAGALRPLGGELTIGPGLSVGYFAQHQLERLDPNAGPLLHLRRRAHDIPEQSLRDYLGGFGFRGERLEAKASSFSGGERARLALALLVWSAPGLLLLDEPTNHLDIDMRQALTSALQGYEGALLLVSHDRHLLRSVTDVLWLVGEGTVAPFDGDLEDYRAWIGACERAASGTSPPASPRKTRRRDAAQRRRERQPLAERARVLEREIRRTSRARDELDSTLADPALYEALNKQRLTDHLIERARIEAELGRLESEWLEAQQALEDFENEPGSREPPEVSN